MPKVQMQLEFYKYHGAGNDFIIVDNRKNIFPISNQHKIILHLCDRRFGIGADGFILLQESDDFDFEMVYYNADGNESTMCGNGGRCIVHFARFLKLIDSTTRFKAIDGEHQATIERESVNLNMINVNKIDTFGNDYFLNTGSPHYVKFVSNIQQFDVYKEGKKIRNSAHFFEKGTNVNFVEVVKTNEIAIRTYERGVENETLACGTGITAAAIIHGLKNNIQNVKVKAQGGELEVNFTNNNNNFTNIWLRGPAKMVYKGIIEL